MRFTVQHIWVLMFFLSAAPSALAQTASFPHEDVRSFIPPFLRDTVNSLSEQIEDQAQFVEEFFDYKKRTDHSLGDIFADLTGMIKNYAEDEGGLEGSSARLTEDIKKFADRFDTFPDGFPHWEHVSRILKPHMDRLMTVLEREFPVLGPMPADGFPLGHFYNYFQEAERRNSFGMGSFFRVEPLRPTRIFRQYASRIRYITEAGIEREEVIYEELRTVQDGQQTGHRLVKDGEVIIDEKRREDFSVLHGLPASMRRAGANERFIRLVEEYIKLVNYHLIENFRQRGLVIPADHPQLAVPMDYSPDTFVTNFISLIMAFQTPG